jgi:hypothetical protein
MSEADNNSDSRKPDHASSDCDRKPQPSSKRVALATLLSGGLLSWASIDALASTESVTERLNAVRAAFGLTLTKSFEVQSPPSPPSQDQTGNQSQPDHAKTDQKKPGQSKPKPQKPEENKDQSKPGDWLNGWQNWNNWHNWTDWTNWGNTTPWDNIHKPQTKDTKARPNGTKDTKAPASGKTEPPPPTPPKE